jgi:hypothetical protein
LSEFVQLEHFPFQILRRKCQPKTLVKVLHPQDTRYSYCSVCGIQVVNTHETFYETCMSCNGQEAQLNTTRLWQESSLVIPVHDSAWAAHQLVEVLFDVDNGIFRYLRIRRDRKVANSASLIKSIINLQLRPVKLSDLSFQAGKTTATHPSPMVPYRASTKVKSEFKHLRNLHHDIKAILYKLFGGSMVVDACCGGLTDHASWEAAGVKQVIAIDQDSQQLQNGRERLLNSAKVSPIAHIKIVNADLSKLCNLEEAISAVSTEAHDESQKQNDIQPPTEIGNSVIDAIFCHFALHFFWETRESSTVFLQNLVPLLRDSGLFVVTYMRSDVIRQQKHVKILNDDGEVEFEAKLQGEKIQVHVASIGTTHFETLMEDEEMKDRFSQAGMDHIATYAFSQLGAMVSQKSDWLTAGEKEMSEMYSASVFKKRITEEEVSSSTNTFDMLPQDPRFAPSSRSRISSNSGPSPRFFEAKWIYLEFRMKRRNGSTSCRSQFYMDTRITFMQTNPET